MKYALYLSMLFVLSATAQTKDEGPTMGWSSWNTYRVNISDSLIMQQADAMVAKGLHKVGYKYIISMTAISEGATRNREDCSSILRDSQRD